MVKPLSGEEYAQISGGYAPPTAEQMRNMDCWQMLSAGRFLYKYNFINQCKSVSVLPIDLH